MQSSRVRFEIFFAAGWLLFGALILPALIFVVGQILFGPYEGGMGTFYGNLYGDLFSGSGRAALLVLGPYLIMLIARLPFLGMKRPADSTEEEQPARKSTGRVEPRLGSD